MTTRFVRSVGELRFVELFKDREGNCQETRTPVTFFLIFLIMDAPPFPISCYIPPFMYCLIDPILLPPLCSSWPVL